MANIPDTAYMTINERGIFVGGKPAWFYRGQEIFGARYAMRVFADMQQKNKDVVEWHVISSETPGEVAKPGDPSLYPGRFAWMRVVLQRGIVGSWVCGYDEALSTDECACTCGAFCASNINIRPDLLQNVLDAACSVSR